MIRTSLSRFNSSYSLAKPISLATQFTSLSKPRLSALVVLTTISGVALSPLSASVPLLLYTSAGTGLCAASANAINQWIEPPFDAQMSRTRNRILVSHGTLPHRAFLIGLASGVCGVGILATMVNPTTAVLGLANILLYTAVYTPMKRTSIYNTHTGAIVGAIPPVMGWTAVGGSLLDPGALVLASILYCWQFPHFNGLSWNLRSDYSKAGYEMMSVVDPALCRRLALQYSVLLLPVCWAAVYSGLDSHFFLLDSTLVNSALVYASWRFYKEVCFSLQKKSDGSAPFLFFVSLVHLPVLLGLMILHK